jgi:phosphoenolpyruvate carboxykinase (ATP)
MHSGKERTDSAPAVLVEDALRRSEGLLDSRGALNVLTGKHTGRSPRDRFLVAGPEDEPLIAWGGFNRRMPADAAERLARRVEEYLASRPTWAVHAHACADPAWRLPVRAVCDTPWQALFTGIMLRDPGRSAFDHATGLTILAASGFEADPARDGTASEAFIVLDFPRRLVLVGGTRYAGEIKKAVFTYLNHRLPSSGVLPMHCSANIGADGKTALFFGLSGTGKTTLSADPERRLIGDDEHGWSDDGIFNFEGGCYAKCINLSPEGEPQIHAALTFGSVLENVVLDPVTRVANFADGSVTENTRAAYPLAHIPGVVPSGRGGHPATILFLACDAFGVLPPVARLSVEQSMYHFLSGYTAKVAGTERGVSHPEATFSACFGSPFLPRPPARYAELLAGKLRMHGSSVWLVNTGWTGGPCGAGGRRMPLAVTRALVRAILAGELDGVPMFRDPVLQAMVPEGCPGVPGSLLRPRSTWKDPAAFDTRARELVGLFAQDFAQHAPLVGEEVRAAGPAFSSG